MSERASERPQSSLGDCLFGRCDLVLDDFVHAIRHEPRTRVVLRWATLGGALSTPLGIWLLSASRLWPGLCALALGLACFAAHNAPEHAAARWYRQTPPRARLMRFTLNADELIVTSDVSSRVYRWASLYGQYQTSESFLVWIDARSFLILPKRAFEPQVLPRVAARLERELGGAPPLSGFWSLLLGCVALILGLLWLWNWAAPR